MGRNLFQKGHSQKEILRRGDPGKFSFGKIGRKLGAVAKGLPITSCGSLRGLGEGAGEVLRGLPGIR